MAILIHFNSVVYIAPDVSTFLNQRKIENPIKLKSSIILIIHQKIHEILIVSTSFLL